jgi:predicted phosphodiesterase
VKLKDAAIASKMYDVFIYGHTHIKEENKIGDTMVLNPGTGHKKSQKCFRCLSGRRNYGF